VRATRRRRVEQNGITCSCHVSFSVAAAAVALVSMLPWMAVENGASAEGRETLFFSRSDNLNSIVSSLAKRKKNIKMTCRFSQDEF
jgi:hypothetical protein